VSTHQLRLALGALGIAGVEGANGNGEASQPVELDAADQKLRELAEIDRAKKANETIKPRQQPNRRTPPPDHLPRVNNPIPVPEVESRAQFAVTASANRRRARTASPAASTATSADPTELFRRAATRRIAEERDGSPAQLGRPRLLRRWWRVIQRLRVDGGQMSVVDSAIRDDAAYDDARLFGADDLGVIGGRGCKVSSGAGDGTYTTRVIARDGKAIYVHLDFTGESRDFLKDARSKLKL